MKAVKSQAIITSVRSLSDGGLSLTIHTPELTPSEKAHYMTLQNVLSDILIAPKENSAPELLTISKDLDKKTPSKRMRDILFVIWKESRVDQDFETYYTQKINSYCESLKRKYLE